MNYQQHLANSAAIRAEIQRFESVHPNIYSIYELLERVDEPLLQNQIREHVIAIEGKVYTLNAMIINVLQPGTVSSPASSSRVLLGSWPGLVLYTSGVDV